MYPDFLRRRVMFYILFSMGWARNSRAWQNEPNEVHHGNLQEQLQGPLSDTDDHQNVIGALSGVVVYHKFHRNSREFDMF